MEKEKTKTNWKHYSLAQTRESGEMEEFDYWACPSAYVRYMREFKRTGCMTDVFFWPNEELGESEDDEDWSYFGPESADDIDWIDFPDVKELKYLTVKMAGAKWGIYDGNELLYSNYDYFDDALADALKMEAEGAEIGAKYRY